MEEVKAAIKELKFSKEPDESKAEMLKEEDKGTSNYLCKILHSIRDKEKKKPRGMVEQVNSQTTQERRPKYVNCRGISLTSKSFQWDHPKRNHDSGIKQKP